MGRGGGSHITGKKNKEKIKSAIIWPELKKHPSGSTTAFFEKVGEG